MTKYQPLWQQAGSYAASVDRGLLGTLWPAGGVTGAAVAAVANTMQVQAAPGTVAVPMQAGQGTELCRWDAAADSTVTLTVGRDPTSVADMLGAMQADIRALSRR